MRVTFFQAESPVIENDTNETFQFLVIISTQLKCTLVYHCIVTVTISLVNVFMLDTIFIINAKGTPSFEWYYFISLQFTKEWLDNLCLFAVFAL